MLTGIIIVQGGPPHHFLLIERFHQGKILLYDNLKGHKWIPSSQLKSKSLVWGFIFRRQDQQQYSFQPKQYKAIAPCALGDAKPPKPPKEAKAPKSRPNPALGINAKKYRFPIKPSKPKETSNAGVPTSHLNVDEPNQSQNTAQANARTSEESTNQPCLSRPKFTGGNESHHHGIPMAGPPTTNNVHCPSTQQEPGHDNRSGQHGIPMAGFPSANPPHCPPTQQELARTQVACNQHEIPIDDLHTTHQQQCIPAQHPHTGDEAESCQHGIPMDGPSAANPQYAKEIKDPGGEDCGGAHSHGRNWQKDTAHVLLQEQAQVPATVKGDDLQPPVKRDEEAGGHAYDREKDASPPKRVKFSEMYLYAIISLFDGVGSAIPAITNAIGHAPRLIIAAECDPVLRQIVGEQFLFRTDGKWAQSSKTTFTIYTDDIRKLLQDHCRLLKEAFALAGPQCRWIVIAGSPCQDLTPAGPLKGLLGLTGPCSSLFYYVHVILWLLQMNYSVELIRFLLENAGTMPEIHRKAILRALGLNAEINPDLLRADPKHTHGIRRNRFYFRNYHDCLKVAKTVVLPSDDAQGPLLDCGGYPIPFGPLLRVRAVLGHEVYQVSWTAYQPISLIWDYLFWGGKCQFQTKAKMQSSDSIPALDYTGSLPPHYLKAWRLFVRALKQTNVTAFERDRLVLAILPIFHHPFITAPMRILSCEEVEKLAGLHNHFDRVHAHRNLLTELTVRNYCGNSFHPEYIQAAIGHPECLRNWLTVPAEPQHNPPWTGVLHPKQARAQYHELREQVRALANTQRIRDLESKQVGIDPMPDFPIHAIQGNLAPIMPTILPAQLLPAHRKFHPDELGIKENKPPSQLSLQATQTLQQENMHALLTGMRFFGAGIGCAEDIPFFFLGNSAESIIENQCPNAKEWLANQLHMCVHCTASMAQTLLFFYCLMHKEQRTVHTVHIIDWEDHTKIFALGDAPAQWTVYCTQFPKSHAFHMDTAAWHCHTRTNIPWQLTPHLTALSTSHLPFQCSNSQCIWFVLPVGPNGQYIVSHETIGTFCSTLCVPCLLARLVPKVFCRIHTSNASYPELSGVLFVDHEGNVAVAAAHDWQIGDSAGHETCLVKATIDDRLPHYPDHQNSLPKINQIGKVSEELCYSWRTDNSLPTTAFFLCSLSDNPQ